MIKLTDTPQKSREIYPKIAEIFGEIEINPTPMNYVVWYHYFLGKNQALINELDQVRQTRKSFPDRLGIQLYQQFIEADEPEASTQYDLAVRNHVETTSEKMNVLKTNISFHSDQMESFAKNLVTLDIQACDLENIAQDIISATANMQSDTSEICVDVQNSSQQVKQLQKQLDEARAVALTDDLTQIGNRKAFNSAIQKLSQEHSENDEPLCLIMTDIDHFKTFNDTYGHPVGDSVLRYFASIMRQDAQENETVCRYGGEEFAILLKNCTIEQASQRAEQIRQKIASAKLSIKSLNKPIKTITASFGVAQLNGQNDHFEDLINRADQSLYMAKESGRNKVIHENMASLN